MSAQIIRICREDGPENSNISSSSMYRRKAASLSSEDKSLLTEVERKFRAKVRREQQSLVWRNSELIRDFKEAIFNTTEGLIYFFLKSDNNVVMLDFNLASPGGGGLAVSAPKTVKREAARQPAALAAKDCEGYGSIRVAFRMRQAIMAFGQHWVEGLASQFRVSREPAPVFEKTVRLLSFLLADQRSNHFTSIIARGVVPQSSALWRIVSGVPLSRQQANRILFGELVGALSAYVNVEDDSFMRPPPSNGPRKCLGASGAHSASTALFSELVHLIATDFGLSGTRSSSPAGSILASRAQGSPPAAYHVRKILFGQTVSALSAHLNCRNRKIDNNESVIRRRGDKAARTKGEVANSHFFPAVTGVISFLNIDGLQLWPRAFPGVLRHPMGDRCEEYVREILFGEAVSALASWVDADRPGGSPPAWSSVWRITEGAPFTTKFAKQKVFCETIATLAGCLDEEHEDTQIPSWSVLARLAQGAPLTNQCVRQIVFGETVTALSSHFNGK